MVVAGIRTCSNIASRARKKRVAYTCSFKANSIAIAVSHAVRY
jgi:uncharacterized ferredoxin-like protein